MSNDVSTKSIKTNLLSARVESLIFRWKQITRCETRLLFVSLTSNV